MKAYALTMTEEQIVWVDGKAVYFKPDIKFDINSMTFKPNKEGSLLKGYKFTKGLYSVELVRLGNALKPKCDTLAQRIDLDCIELGLKKIINTTEGKA